MKQIFKRICVIMLSLCLLVGILGCAADSATKMNEAAKAMVSTEKISFVDADGKATFNVVRADAENSEAGPVSVEIFKAYKETYDVSPRQYVDSDSDEATREILVGDCEREATKTVKRFLEENGTGRQSDYIICSVDEDIVIYGGCLESLKAAGECFIKNYLKKPQKKGIYYFHKGDEKGATVCDISDVSRFKVVRPIYNVSYITQQETEKLCDALYKKTGYEVPIVHDRYSVEDYKEEVYCGKFVGTEPSEYEIIIGNCERDGVKKIDVSYSYEIRIEDKKIYLNGGSPYATAMAVSEFTKIVQKNKVIDSSLSVLNGNYNTAAKEYDNKTYYKPKWWDEFNGSYIDVAKWNVAWDVKGGTSVEGKPCYRGSSKLKNNYVKDGNLVIEAVKTEDAYYGGMLKTDRTMEFLYGYLEISDIHPKGNGFWTALWMVSKSSRYNRDMWYSETDVDEAFGDGYSIVGNLWAWPTSYGRNMLNLHNGRNDTVKDNGKYYSDDPRGLWMDFHTYGFEWVDCKTIRFTIDGYVWRETVMDAEELQKVYSQYMYLQVSMATAFDSRGQVSQNEWEWENTNKLIVDWIYLYQLEGHGLM